MTNKKQIGCLAAGALIAVVVWYALGPPDGLRVRERPASTELSAWLADWHWEAGVTDFRALAGGLSSLQLFAAYFDEADRLLFTANLREAVAEIKAERANLGPDAVYLSVVNDIVSADGSSVQKDSALVSRLLADSSSRARHIDALAEAVAAYGFDGLEIDYERIGDGDWVRMIAFIEALHARLEKDGKRLRIVLEPRAPLETIELPAGPVYIMMAYNLYGAHSGPGPKADPAFIGELAARMNRVPGENIIAFAAGGFDWTGEREARQLTERQAVALAAAYRAAPVRDEASGGMHFDYLDEQGKQHTVWYADGETLTGWFAHAAQAGYPQAALWRLGELDEPTLDELNGYFG